MACGEKKTIRQQAISDLLITAWSKDPEAKYDKAALQHLFNEERAELARKIWGLP